MKPSWQKFAPQVKPRGIILINSSLTSVRSGRNDVDALCIPTIEIAQKIGSVKVANSVALAALVARSKIVDFDLMRQCVKAEFLKKKKLIPINMEAIDAGKQAALINT
jgi:2-oxoglutarate ferredoxin oxidoreductase subunit gamma